jgi:hypothetical protein
MIPLQQQQRKPPPQQTRVQDSKSSAGSRGGSNLRSSGTGPSASKPLASSSGLFAPKRGKNVTSPAKRKERDSLQGMPSEGVTSIIEHDETRLGIYL